MFKEIQPHLKEGSTLNLAISVSPYGEFNVVVDQKSGASLAGHQLPKALTATAEEFDECLTDILVKYLSVRRSLNDQISDLEVVANSIAEEARANTQASDSKSSAVVQRPKSRTAVPPALLDTPADGDEDHEDDQNETGPRGPASTGSPIPADAKPADDQLSISL
jgi:PRTRC genetic system protein E